MAEKLKNQDVSSVLSRASNRDRAARGTNNACILGSSAARVREFRARARRHSKLIAIEISNELPLALCEAGFLAEWDTENRSEIRKAIEKVLARMTEVRASIANPLPTQRPSILLQCNGVTRHTSSSNSCAKTANVAWRRATAGSSNGGPSSEIGYRVAARIHFSRVAGGRGFPPFTAAAFFRQRRDVKNDDLQAALARLVELLRERMGKYRRRCRLMSAFEGKADMSHALGSARLCRHKAR